MHFQPEARSKQELSISAKARTSWTTLLLVASRNDRDGLEAARRCRTALLFLLAGLQCPGTQVKQCASRAQLSSCGTTHAWAAKPWARVVPGSRFSFLLDRGSTSGFLHKQYARAAEKVSETPRSCC